MKKTIILVLSLVCVLMFALVGCDNKSDDGKTSATDSASSSVVAAKTLTKIELTTMPAKTEYDIGETIDTMGMKVTATFSDGSTADVTADCTTSMGANPVEASTTAYYVKYVYEKVTKTVKVDITVNKVEVTVHNLAEMDPVPEMKAPWKVAVESQADYVLITSYDSTTMVIDGVLELNGDLEKGAFRYTERNDKQSDGMIKYAYLNGSYKVAEGKMTLTAKDVYKYETAHLDSATVDVADVILSADGKLEGLYFGSMVTGAGSVFGWSKKSASAFVESLATNYGYEASTCYFEIVNNNAIPADVILYHANVASIEVATNPEKTAYTAGETFISLGLTVKVNYEAGASRIIATGFDVDTTTTLGATDEAWEVSYTTKDYNFDENVKKCQVAISVEAAEANELVSISAEGAPETCRIQYGTTLTLKQWLDSNTFTVKGNYGDESSAEITDYTIVDGDTVITAAMTEYKISYTKDEQTFEYTVSLKVSYMTPFEIAASSNANYVFVTYFTKQSNKLNGCLELFGDLSSGTYTYTAQMGADKYNVNAGTYAIENGVINMTCTSYVQVLGTSAMVTGASETATLVMKDGAVIGLNFGEAATDGFWGYTSASKPEQWTANISHDIDENLTYTTGYMALWSEVSGSDALKNNTYYN